MFVPVLLALLAGAAGAQSDASPIAPTATPSFVENHGQWPAEVRFRYRQGPATAFLHDDGLTLALMRQDPWQPALAGEGTGRAPRGLAEQIALRWTFENAALNARPRGEDELGARHNFYLGNDPSRWATAVNGSRHGGTRDAAIASSTAS